jgi:hypothetical protein
MEKDTYYHSHMGREVKYGGPFDRLPTELQKRFIDVFYDGLYDASAGAVAHAASGSEEHMIRQLVRVLEFADNPAAMQVISDVVEELEEQENKRRRDESRSGNPN